MKVKAIIAISQQNTPPWSTIRIGQEKTWISRSISNCSIIHFSSKKPILIVKLINWFMEKYRYSEKFGKLVSLISIFVNKIVSRKIPKYIFNNTVNELYVDSYSTYFSFGRRTLSLFDWFINSTDAEFLFMTNTSSFINIQNFMKLVDQYDSSQLIYLGAIINPNSNSFPIVSGAGKLLSRPLVLKILQNRELLQFNNVEDICLAELIFKLNVKAEALPRLDIPSIEHLEKLPNGILLQHFHFRCKSEKLPRNDAQIMEMLDARIFLDSNKTDKTDN